MKKKTHRSSETLLKVAQLKSTNGKLTYQTILESLGDRAFGIVLLFFSLPSALPLAAIPSISVIFSLPILLFSSQIIWGRKTLWLPQVLAKHTISQQTISKINHKAVPYLIKVEHLLKPRWPWMTCRFMEILNGIVIFCLAIFLMLPIPFSNFVFAALLILFSLGLIEKDGLFIALGYLGTIVYVSFIYLLIAASVKHLWH